MKILQINAVYGQGSTGTIVRDIEYLCERSGIECYVASTDSRVRKAKRSYLIGNMFDHKLHAVLARINGKQAYFNSRVSVYYKGSLTDGTEFDARLFEDGTPFKCAVSSYYANYSNSNPNGYGSVISGWTVALQHMVEGDKYEVWIPQQLAYGASDNGDIPAYSTLIFEIELVSVDEQAASAS